MSAGGNTHILSLMLQHKADINLVTKNGKSFLEFVNLLGETPLDFACIKNDVVIVAALLDAGASIQTPGLLHSAILGAVEKKKKKTKKKERKISFGQPIDTVEDESVFSLLKRYNYCFSYVDAAGIFQVNCCLNIYR
jgi:ankyrin repeat protein